MNLVGNMRADDWLIGPEIRRSYSRSLQAADCPRTLTRIPVECRCFSRMIPIRRSSTQGLRRRSRSSGTRFPGRRACPFLWVASRTSQYWYARRPAVTDSGEDSRATGRAHRCHRPEEGHRGSAGPIRLSAPGFSDPWQLMHRDSSSGQTLVANSISPGVGSASWLSATAEAPPELSSSRKGGI